MILPALKPLSIRGLTLRNRFVKSATYEGLTPGGRVTDQLVDFHARIASNQIALTTIAYGAVAPQGRTFGDQLLLDEDSVAGLARVADAVHVEGGALSLQLAHCGGFSKLQKPIGPSRCLNLYGLASGFPWVKPANEREIASTIEAYRVAARRAKTAGVDAVEIHFGHGYLLSQFLSPLTNRRRDCWGGDLEGRLKLPTEVIGAVRDAVGDAFPIFAKINLQDGLRGGLTLEESREASQAFVAAGVDALIPSGGMVQKNAFFLMRGGAPIRKMALAEENFLQRIGMQIIGSMIIRRYPYQPTFFFADAAKLCDQVNVPVGLLGGVDSTDSVDRALNAGFAFVVMARALLADPDFVLRYAQGDRVYTRCNQCNECIASMNQGLHCTLDDG